MEISLFLLFPLSALRRLPPYGTLSVRSTPFLSLISGLRSSPLNSFCFHISNVSIRHQKRRKHSVQNPHRRRKRERKKKVYKVFCQPTQPTQSKRSHKAQDSCPSWLTTEWKGNNLKERAAWAQGLLTQHIYMFSEPWRQDWVNLLNLDFIG